MTMETHTAMKEMKTTEIMIKIYIYIFEKLNIYI
jgi:hypothetical protein